MDINVPADLRNAILPALIQKDADHFRWMWTMATSEVLRTRADKVCHFVRMAEIDVTDLVEEIEQKPQEYWASYPARKRIAVQRETDSVILRAAKFARAGDVDKRIVDHIQECEDTRHAKHYSKIMKYLREFAAAMHSELSRVIVARLAPGKQVYPHFDGGLYYLIRDRYHLVVRSPLGSKMRCMNDVCTFKEGELWWFNNKVEHEAFNEGDGWRIHIIFDLLPNHLVPLMEQIKQVTAYYQDQKRSVAAALPDAPVPGSQPSRSPEQGRSGLSEGQRHLAVARRALNEGRLAEARGRLDELLKVEPANVPARQLRGVTFVRLGEVDRGIADLEFVRAARPDDAAVHRLLGAAFQSTRRFDEALAAFARAIELDPDDGASLNNRGVIRRDRGELDDALADFERAVTLAPTNALIIANRGTVFERKGEFDRALADYDRAIVLDPSDRRASALRESIMGAKARHATT